MSKVETVYQRRLIDRIEREFPGSIVLKSDPSEIQGFPDLLILYKDKWAALEVKMAHDSDKEPNQEYYVDLLGRMSYCSFIYPAIEELVFHELQRALNGRG